MLHCVVAKHAAPKDLLGMLKADCCQGRLLCKHRTCSTHTSLNTLSCNTLFLLLSSLFNLVMTKERMQGSLLGEAAAAAAAASWVVTKHNQARPLAPA